MNGLNYDYSYREFSVLFLWRLNAHLTRSSTLLIAELFASVPALLPLSFSNCLATVQSPPPFAFYSPAPAPFPAVCVPLSVLSVDSARSSSFRYSFDRRALRSHIHRSVEAVPPLRSCFDPNQHTAKAFAYLPAPEYPHESTPLWDLSCQSKD